MLQKLGFFCKSKNKNDIDDIPSYNLYDGIKVESSNKVDLCKNALQCVKIDVLSKSIVDYDEALINNYGAYSTEYDKATILVLGIQFASKDDYYNYWYSLSVCDCNTHTPVLHTISSWLNNSNTYMIMLVRIGGVYDISDLYVRVKGEIDDISIVKTLSESVGFESAIQAFSGGNCVYGSQSDIINLKNRHYLITQHYDSSSGWGSKDKDSISYTYQSYVLIPLEDGFSKTLSNDDFELKESVILPNIEVELSVNQSIISRSELKCQSVISVGVIRLVPEFRTKLVSDDETRLLISKIEQEKSRVLSNIIVESRGEDSVTFLFK